MPSKNAGSSFPSASVPSPLRLFSLSDGVNIEYDGLRHTGRVEAGGTCEVPMTTIDIEWKNLGSPPISVIKCDVEGGEIGVLLGARSPGRNTGSCPHGMERIELSSLRRHDR